MSAAKPAALRPSASVILVNALNEVMLVHRSPSTTAFAGFYAFPGGNLDTKQDDSPQMTAIRETFEETGVLLAAPSEESPISDALLLAARKAIHDQHLTFPRFMEDTGLIPQMASLLPFSQWKTPSHLPKRYHTHFYVHFVPAGAEIEPVADDSEIKSVAFYPLTLFSSTSSAPSGMKLMPPQHYLLNLLANLLPTSTQTPEQISRVRQLSQSEFGSRTFDPQHAGFDSEKRVILAYEGDEARGGPKGARHRSLVRPGKAGVADEVALERNINIFEDHVGVGHSPRLSAKL